MRQVEWYRDNKIQFITVSDIISGAVLYFIFKKRRLRNGGKL